MNLKLLVTIMKFPGVQDGRVQQVWLRCHEMGHVVGSKITLSSFTPVQLAIAVDCAENILAAASKKDLEYCELDDGLTIALQAVVRLVRKELSDRAIQAARCSGEFFAGANVSDE